MRPPTIGLVLIALFAVLLLWWRWPAAPDGGAVAPGAAELGPGDVADAGPRGADVSAGENAADGRRAELPGERPSEKAPSADTSSGLVRLRGRLRRSDDGAPAAGASLVFFFGGEAAPATSDEEGRFVTERVVRPGAVRVAHRADVLRSEYASRLDVEPRDLLVPAGDALGEVPPFELTLLVPDAWLVVEARLPDGRPAAGADVERALSRREGAGRRPVGLATVECDPEGRARIPVRGGDGAPRVALLARHEELVSEVVELSEPWPAEPVALALEPGGELRVHVLDEAGQPVADRRVDARLLGRDDFLGGVDGSTGPAGSITFRALAPGRYRAVTWVEELREWISAEIEIARGEAAELTLEVPRLELQLAAAGRVVDEAGEPLSGVEVALEHESGRVSGTRSDAEGRFELVAEPCGVVTVAMDRDLWGDEYEPPRRRVAFGTRGLEFRLRAAAELETLLLEVVDARTGARVPGAAVMPYRAPNLGNYSLVRADEGLAAARCKAHEFAAFGVAAPGYRRRYVPRAELLPGGEGAQARVELARGYERTFRVRAPDGAPLRGAELRVDGELVATADVEGLARVDLPDWPAAVAVGAAGFRPTSVAPADFLWDLGPAVVELPPAGTGSK